MAGPAPIFREIHRLRSFIHDLQEQVDRVPRQRKAQQARLAKQEQTLKDEQDLIKKLKVTASDREKTIRQKGELIARYEGQLATVTVKKEFDALKLEIAHTKEVVGQLEEETFAAIAESEERQAKLPELEKTTAQVRAEVAKFEAEIGPREAGWKEQMAKARADLKQVEAQLPADIRPLYDRSVASLGADALAAVRDGTCTSCYTEIILQMQQDLRQEQMVLCRSCGRILYLPEEVNRKLLQEDDE